MRCVSRAMKEKKKKREEKREEKGKGKENQEKMEAEEMEEGEPEISQDKINDKDHGIIRRDDGKKMAYQNLEIFSSNSSEDTGICLSIVVNGVTYAGKLHVLGLEKFDAL